MSLSDVSRGRWCPNCKNKTEAFSRQLDYFLFNRQSKYEWCKNTANNYLPFDFTVFGTIRWMSTFRTGIQLEVSSTE